MASKIISDQIGRNQAGLEAVELLNEVGFMVEDFDVYADPEDYTIDLRVSLALRENERPLENLE